ncbi:MAG: MutS-related protein [Bacteroidota bacterium]
MATSSNRHLFYETEATFFRQALKKQQKRRNVLSFVRLVLFLSAVVFLIKGIDGAAGFFYLSALLMVLFFVLVAISLKLGQKLRFLKRLLLLNEDEAKQLQHKKGVFPFRANRYADADERAQDLDLFSEAGLFSRLDRCITKQGGLKVAERLMGLGKPLAAYTKEQAAIKELAGYAAWRQEFMAIRDRNEPLDASALYGWLSADGNSYKLSAVWRGLRYLIPLLSLTFLAFVIFQWIPVWSLFAWILANFMLLSSFSGKVMKIHAQLGGYFQHIQSYRRVIQHIHRQTFSSELLLRLQNQLTHDAKKSFADLERILMAFDNRLNILVSVALNGLFLWDIQCVYRLHVWHKKNSNTMQLWLSMIETFDMYVSLGNFAFNHPDYTYAREDREVTLQARAMGHPLIPGEERVCNDFALKPRNIALVTGANMAGKSTFLRTLGVNYLLANAGLPVCANSFHFTPGLLLTGLRTQDSLEKHESYFLAELKGLKHILEQVKESKPHLFLIDEMLKGTNSKDKLEGSMAVVRNLLAHGGTGVIATHDLPVTQLSDEFPGKVHNYCFEIDLHGTRMSFDYRLQEGITKNMNASLLLKNMGLVEERFFNTPQKEEREF